MFIQNGIRQFEFSLPGLKAAVKKSPLDTAIKKEIIRRIHIRITGVLFLFLLSTGLFIYGLHLLSFVSGEYRLYIIIGLNAPLIVLNIVQSIIRLRRKSRSRRPGTPLTLEKFLMRINREYQTDFRLVTGL